MVNHGRIVVLMACSVLLAAATAGVRVAPRLSSRTVDDCKEGPCEIDGRLINPLCRDSDDEDCADVQNSGLCFYDDFARRCPLSCHLCDPEDDLDWTPAPEPTPTPKPTSTPALPCEDIDEVYCADTDNSGLCFHDDYARDCPVACGVCDPEDDQHMLPDLPASPTPTAVPIPTQSPKMCAYTDACDRSVTLTAEVGGRIHDSCGCSYDVKADCLLVLAAQ